MKKNQVSELKSTILNDQISIQDKEGTNIVTYWKDPKRKHWTKKRINYADSLPNKTELSNNNLNQSRKVKPQYTKEEIKYWKRREKKDWDISMSNASIVGFEIAIAIVVLVKIIDYLNKYVFT